MWANLNICCEFYKGVLVSIKIIVYWIATEQEVRFNYCKPAWLSVMYKLV